MVLGNDGRCIPHKELHPYDLLQQKHATGCVPFTEVILMNEWNEMAGSVR